MEVKAIFLIAVVAAVAAQEPASSCVPAACQLPNCRCASTEIPGGLEPRDTPQFITVTFDDAVTVQNIQTYREVLYNRKNRNNCQIGSTFYISHEYTDYSIVNELYNEGFEVALHSISHKSPPSYWATASYEEVSQEFGDQKKQMAAFANIPESAIKGMRMPFLQMTGNTHFSVMADAGLEYDSSWGATNSINPGLWPYTLDYASPQECNIGPCPNATFPGLWVSPMLAWIDNDGYTCTMVDSCFSKPGPNDEDAWVEFYIRNFERHYNGNRAPFGYYIHEAHFTSHPASKTALARFLDTVTQLYDVFVVNEHDVIEWVKNPIPVDEYLKKDCKFTLRRQCQSRACGPYFPTHNQFNQEYRLQLCSACPATYPWTGNHLGTN
ncbi:chitin deacetylase 7-like [Plutella xylostella]|uniref:chitin deacetylase 7-like n=1 Tax=Plutella xylostella TaxID=51655 RepID=UPI00203226B2|nr:chitin deacetylase 7-like [Plutella xylostella]